MGMCWRKENSLEPTRNKMQVWKTRSKTALLSFGKWMTVESHVVELPDGRVIEDWPWVITPDFASIVAFTPQDQLVCFRQVKYAVEGESFAPPGGYIEPGEDPLEAAKRELLEETGYHLNSGTGGPYTTLCRHHFVATDCRRVSAQHLDETEFIEVV